VTDLPGPVIAAAGFVVVIFLIFVRVPVAIAMGIVGAAGYAMLQGWDSLTFILGRAAFEQIFPLSLSVIPLFVMMGVFSAHAGLSRGLYDGVAGFVGHLRGGLAMATVGASAVFGAVCGSAVATTATMGRVALPEMRRHKYHDSLSSASIAAGGTLGVMIPPSVLLMLYGLSTEQSIGKLFAAGILPGILGAFLYSLAVGWSVRRNPESGPAGVRVSWRDRLHRIVTVWKVFILFGVTLGGMYFGFFSPTEAAAVGAFGAFTAGVLSGEMKLPALRRAVVEVSLTSGMIFVILIGAGIFNYFIDASGVNEWLVQAVKDLGWGPWWIMLALMVMYFVLGAFMDELSMILLTIGPVFTLVTSLGFDPIWFGVMLVTVCEIGMIVPPVGINLFVIQEIGGLKMNTVIRGIAPFVMGDIARLVLLSLFPAIALWLPSKMF
jgi:tripartite ATP-independent transporter DctM subunit